MINTEIVDDLLKELEQSKEKIYAIELHISFARHWAHNGTHADWALEMLEQFEQDLEIEKLNVRFINDILTLEYEQLKINPILQELHT